MVCLYAISNIPSMFGVMYCLCSSSHVSVHMCVCVCYICVECVCVCLSVGLSEWVYMFVLKQYRDIEGESVKVFMCMWVCVCV